MPIELSTNQAPHQRRLAFWQDIVCDTFVQLDCRSDLGDDLHGAIRSSMLGTISCTHVTSSAQRVYRTAARIARSREDYILIALGREGIGGVVQDGRDVVVHPGTFALYDTTRPYELLFDADFRQTIFQIPRAALQQRVAGTEAVTAVSFDRQRPLDRLALDFLTGLAGLVDEVDDDTAARLSEQALDLVAMAIGDRLAHHAVSPSSHRAALLYRLKAYIRAHLADPELSLTGTAAALGISPRYVNNLLADEQTSFQRHVLEQRLAQCHRALASTAQAHRQIGEIAFAWGFNDLSHFGRVFREHYGQSPRAWRASRMSG